jgi:outer membrane usher protein
MKHPKATIGALWCAMGIVPAACWPADVLVAAINPAQSETIVVRIILNTENKGDFFVERTPSRNFLVKTQDLKAMGFKEPPGTSSIVDGEPHILLQSMPGVSFEFRERELALHITANPQLLASQSFGVEELRRSALPPSPTQNSFFANYALSAGHSDIGSSGLGFAGEVGWRHRDFLFLSDGTTVDDGFTGKRKFVRLMSSVTHDDREALRRTVLGDFFTPAREFSAGINLGGVSISKLFGLNPYFVQFPMQSVSGNVALPSDLDVYIDGQRVRSERLKPGEFELNDILAYGGARNIQLVLRDSFGRVQQLDYSFYFSDQPLRKGLHEYSYNLGAIRRGFGLQSNLYGPGAFSMFHRHGFSDAVTLGVRAEATKDLVNIGPTATLVLGSSGVLSLAAARSTIAGRQGAAGSASYTYQAKNWSAGVSVRREWDHYAALADPPLVTNRKAEASVSASYRMDQRGTLSLGHSFLSTRGGMVESRPTATQPYSVAVLEDRRRTTLSYNVPLVSGWAALTTSVSHIKERLSGSRNEAFVGVTVFFGKDYSLAASWRGDKDTNSQLVELTKQQPIGEGLGFNMIADRAADPLGHSQRFKSSVQYNAPAAIVRADVSRDRDRQGNTFDEYRASVAGGIGSVEGMAALGRPITGSFGIVRVGELAGVGVFVNGQRVGETDERGRVFVPSLSAYRDNEVSLAPETVPIDYSMAAVTRRISPAYRGGTVIDFAATKLQAFSGKLKVQHKEGPKPFEYAEMKLDDEKKTGAFQTGRGGEFYVENLSPGTHTGTAIAEGSKCAFDLVIPKSDETFVDLGEVVCRPRP